VVAGGTEQRPGTLATEAVEEYTFRFEIDEPFASTLQVISNNQLAAVPEEIVGDIPGYEGRMPPGPIRERGTDRGRALHARTVGIGHQAVVERFENYHGTGPKIEGVRWQVIEDASALYNYVMNRNADGFNVPTAQYSREKLTVDRTDEQGRKHGTYSPLRNGATANYLGVPTLSVFYMGFNVPNVPKPVREAVAYALNQDTIVEQVFRGRGVPAYRYMTPSVYPGGPDAYEQHAKQQYPYGYGETQLDQARQVMKQAGYGPNNVFDLTFTIYQEATWDRTAKLLRDQLRNAHVRIEIQQVTPSSLLERVQQGTVEAFSLE
jgi:peptide/nickel transport system substrate-binding protein